jgi:hypothetical protein
MSELKIRNQRSEVRGQKSEVRSQRSEVRGQRSDVRSQRSEVRGQRSEVVLLTFHVCRFTLRLRSGLAFYYLLFTIC